MQNRVVTFTSIALIFLATGCAVDKVSRTPMCSSTGLFVFLDPECAEDKGQPPINASPMVKKISSMEQTNPGKNQSDNQMDNDYMIGPEDVIEVSVWKNNDLSKTVIVRPDGQISLPLIGDVKASGLTPSELNNAIANKLKEYKEDPTVSVIVQQINSYNIFIMGEVVHPGKYSLKSNTTLLQVLSLAGGFTPYASRNKILLMRKDPRTLAVTEVRIKYDAILSGNDPQRDILLKPGDTIVVP